MDAPHFDRLARTLADRSSRRTALGVSLGGMLGALGLVDAAAKRRKKCKKACGPCKKCKHGKCKPKPNGLDCGVGRVCQSGACICPTECCADADCNAVEDCLANGSCAINCTAIPCPGGCSCIPSVDGPSFCIDSSLICDDVPQECTSTTDCPPGESCQVTFCGPGETAANRCVPLCFDRD